MFLLPRAPVSEVACTAFVSCRHICLIIMSHSLIFCFVSQINLIRFELDEQNTLHDVLCFCVVFVSPGSISDAVTGKRS